jgi:hypothetical protein
MECLQSLSTAVCYQNTSMPKQALQSMAISVIVTAIVLHSSPLIYLLSMAIASPVFPFCSSVLTEVIKQNIGSFPCFSECILRKSDQLSLLSTNQNIVKPPQAFARQTSYNRMTVNQRRQSWLLII